MLESSERFVEAKNKLSHHGIGVGEVTLDIEKMLARKNAVVKQLTSGVGFLFKKNKIDSILGAGKIINPTTVEVKGNDGKTTTLNTKRIIIATGSVPIELPGLRSTASSSSTAKGRSTSTRCRRS